MAHIVIIGAGIGGVPCAYELRKRLAPEHRVTLIGTSPFFEFTPSNPWIAVGWRKPAKTRVELCGPLRTKGIAWWSDPVTMIDAAERFGDGVVGILLTGMGNDGKAGMLAIKAGGGHTIAESEETAEIFGMPREAIHAGAVNQVLPLASIATALLTRARTSFS